MPLFSFGFEFESTLEQNLLCLSFDLFLDSRELLMLFRVKLRQVGVPQDVAENLVDLLCHQPDVRLEPVIREQCSTQWEDILRRLSVRGNLPSFFGVRGKSENCLTIFIRYLNISDLLQHVKEEWLRASHRLDGQLSKGLT